MLVYQGTIVILMRFCEPVLGQQPGVVDSIGAVSGLLVFCVALVILGLKKIELADYLPSLVIAPALAWLWR